MGIRASFGGVSGRGIYDEASIKWLFEMNLIDSLDEKTIQTFSDIDIELKETPEVLSYFSQLENELHISRITRDGIVFYLTDVPLWHGVPEEERRVTTEKNYGYIFVPMSNVVCFNTFGNAIPKIA